MVDINLCIVAPSASFGINIPVKPNKNIYQRIRDDRNSVDPLETADIYRINYRREERETGAYIGKTKRKITETSQNTKEIHN